MSDAHQNAGLIKSIPIVANIMLEDLFKEAAKQAQENRVILIQGIILRSLLALLDEKKIFTKQEFANSLRAFLDEDNSILTEAELSNLETALGVLLPPRLVKG